MVKQYEKELYDLLLKTDELCNSEDKVFAETDIETETKIVVKTFGDPLTDFVTEPSIRNEEPDGDEELLKVMVEPLDVPIPKDKQSDDELPYNEELDSGAIETQPDDPDFDCKAEDDDSSFDDEDDDYVPQKRKIKPRKSTKTVTTIKVEDSEEATPRKKRGRKPKNKDGQNERKPRKKREKKSHECKDCEKIFEKLVDYVVRILELIIYIKIWRSCEVKPLCFYVCNTLIFIL